MSAQPEGLIWVQTQALAGNWCDCTGRNDTPENLEEARRQVKWHKKERGTQARIVRKFIEVLPE